MLDVLKTYPTSTFFLTLEESIEKLKKVGHGSKDSGKEYESIKQRLISYAREPNGEFVIHKQDDIRRILSVLLQETNSQGVDILELLIVQRKLNGLFKLIENSLEDSNKNLICKKLLTIYYSRYFLFEKVNKDGSYSFRKLLNDLVKQYDSKNLMVIQAKANPEILKNNFKPLFEKYKNHKSIEEIYKTLGFLEHFEIWHRMRVILLLEQVERWGINQWDDDVTGVLTDIVTHKNVNVNSRNLVEETVYLTIKKLIDNHLNFNSLSQDWYSWIIDNVGDPRISKHRNAWNRIGEECFSWFLRGISRGDVKEFLNSMTDGHGDDIYQYRRQFWLQYIDEVQYAKIMLKPNDIVRLQFINPEMYKRFKTTPEVYSKLNDRERSCIFIDFGHFYVIEGTHTAKVRFYNGVPIRLDKHDYIYESFFHGKAYEYLIEEFSHQSSGNYIWQNKVRRFIADNWKINVPLEQIILSEDRKRLKSIRDYLFNRGESVT